MKRRNKRTTRVARERCGFGYRIAFRVAVVSRLVSMGTQPYKKRLARTSLKNYGNLHHTRNIGVSTSKVWTRPGVELCESGSRMSMFEGGLLGFVVSSPLVVLVSNTHIYVRVCIFSVA